MCPNLRSLFVQIENTNTFLIHILSTPASRARAGNLHVFYGEFVVIGQLLTGKDFARGKNDDVLLAVNVNYFGVAIGLK